MLARGLAPTIRRTANSLLILDRLEVEAVSCYLPPCGQERSLGLPGMLWLGSEVPIETSLICQHPLLQQDASYSFGLRSCRLDSQLSPLQLWMGVHLEKKGSWVHTG